MQCDFFNAEFMNEKKTLNWLIFTINNANKVDRQLFDSTNSVFNGVFYYSSALHTQKSSNVGTGDKLLVRKMSMLTSSLNGEKI